MLLQLSLMIFNDLIRIPLGQVFRSADGAATLD